MALARIKFGNLLLDRTQVPSLKVIQDPQDPRAYKIELSMGIITTPLDSSDDNSTCRELEIGADVYRIPLSAAIGLQKPALDTDPSSTITVVFKADLSTKLPRTGEFKIIDLDKLQLD